MNPPKSPATNGNGHAHDSLSFLPDGPVRKFYDKTTNGDVSVTWKWNKRAAPCEHYTCTIKQKEDTAYGYSLYNLEIQGWGWKVEVVKAQGQKVEFFNEHGEPVTGAIVIPPAFPVKKSLHGDSIWFIKFAGKQCKLTLSSLRARHGKAMEIGRGPGTKSGHDGTPPPNGGGE